jgi:hypothetical protein
MLRLNTIFLFGSGLKTMILAIGISGPGPGLAEMGATEYQLMSVL